MKIESNEESLKKNIKKNVLTMSICPTFKRESFTYTYYYW